MRIIAESFLSEAAERYPKAATYLEAWRKIAKAAVWRNLVDVRRGYPSADLVRVASGRQVLVFNVCGNDYRLIAAPHFNSQILFTLRFLTHAQYSKDQWKNEL